MQLVPTFNIRVGQDCTVLKLSYSINDEAFNVAKAVKEEEYCSVPTHVSGETTNWPMKQASNVDGTEEN